MFAEYTRRYQDIFLNMSDDIYDGTAKVDTRTKRYMRLYFDLCSEEYQLWKGNVVPIMYGTCGLKVCKLLVTIKYIKTHGTL